MFKLNLDTLTDELADGERLDLWFEQIPNTFTLVLTWTDWRGTGVTLKIDRVFDLSQLDYSVASHEMVFQQYIVMLRSLRESKKLL